MSEVHPPPPAAVPVLLVIHPDPVTRHHLKLTLSAGHHAHALCVESSDEALHLLADGINGLAVILVPWDLPAEGAFRFLDGLNILAPKPRPAVIIVGGGQSPHELHDLNDVGATSIIDAPAKLEDVARELVSLRQTGSSPGRTRLVTGAVARPQGEPARISKDPNWRDRMVRLAATTRSRSAEFRRNRLVALLGRLDEIAGGRLSMAYVEVLLLMARNDARQAESLIRAENLNRDTIDRLFTVVEERMQFPGGQPAPRAVIMHAIEELLELARLRRRGDGWTANYSDLKAGATDVLLGRLSLESPAAKGYRDRLCAWLGIDAEMLGLVDNDRLRRIASRVVKEPDEQNAMDFARLSLLAHLLKIKRIVMAGQGLEAYLRSMGGLLGDAESAADLRERARALAENREIHPEDVPMFAEFASLFSVIEGAASSLGFDEASLSSLRSSVATAAGVTPPAPGRPLPASPPEPGAHRESPRTTPAPTAAPPAPAPPRADPNAARLLPRLASDLGLAEGFFSHLHAHESRLLAQLDRGPLLDIQLPPAVLARLRVLAVLVVTENVERRGLLQAAVVTHYDQQPEALDALLQVLSRSGTPEVTAAFRKSLGLLPRPSPPREVRQILEAEDPTLTWLALRDLRDDDPESIAILEAALDQLARAAISQAGFEAVRQAVERRIARLRMHHAHR
jgi:hypothetical protein